MARIEVRTPRGYVVSVDGRRAQLRWNEGFATKRKAQLENVQQYIDYEVLRLCDKRVPLDTGMLKKSGILGTEVGSGEVNYIAPYAADQYYNTSETRSYDPNRGAHWFERMKTADKDEILRGAQRFVNRGDGSL